MRPQSLCVIALCAAFALSAPPAAADPGGKGHGKGHGHDHHGQQRGNPGFSTHDRSFIGNYYTSLIQTGHCPPGLAKKGNGCQPPGQARRWSMGQPLPSGLVTYPLPPDLLRSLHPPSGYRYVRVGSDVLMLAVGTNMVVSALRDIVR